MSLVTETFGCTTGPCGALKCGLQSTRWNGKRASNNTAGVKTEQFLPEKFPEKTLVGKWRQNLIYSHPRRPSIGHQAAQQMIKPLHWIVSRLIEIASRSLWDRDSRDFNFWQIQWPKWVMSLWIENLWFWNFSNFRSLSLSPSLLRDQTPSRLTSITLFCVIRRVRSLRA